MPSAGHAGKERRKARWAQRNEENQAANGDKNVAKVHGEKRESVRRVSAEIKTAE